MNAQTLASEGSVTVVPPMPPVLPDTAAIEGDGGAPPPELDALEVLRDLKRRMFRDKVDTDEIVSPFDDRVTTLHGEIAGYDLPDIHGAVRESVAHLVGQVRDGQKKSQVILLAGEAGSGKTHLIRSFQTPDATERLGHIFVGGSNQWRIGEFEARLLDWMLNTLTAPSPTQANLLSERVRDIGFRAAEMILENPVTLRRCLARHRGGWVTRAITRIWGNSHDRIKQLSERGDPAIFEMFDFREFSDYVCSRFLAETSNPTHRYALRVLLVLLFPDRRDTGLGPQERVLHWFRGRSENHYFRRRFGVDERLDRQFAMFEAIKLLVHLFSPVVSKALSTERRPCPAKVFVFAFDQAEGRHELFDSDQDWRDFFAQLGELYNTLPNVVILFTMTLGLRNRLQSTMERQFRDRIRMEDKFVLRNPDDDQVCELYRSRIAYWLRDDGPLLARYEALPDPYLPFGKEKVLEIAGQESVRDVLSEFDKEFHRTINDLVLEPELDFRFFLRELNRLPEVAEQNEFQFAVGHLTTVHSLLQGVGSWLATGYGVTLDEADFVSECNPPTLRLKFGLASDSSLWVRAMLVQISYKNIQLQADQAFGLLSNLQRARYFLFLVRSQAFDIVIPESRTDQVFTHSPLRASEAGFRGLLHLLSRQASYRLEHQWSAVEDIIRREIAESYLGEMFREAHRRLKILSADNTDVGQGEGAES